MLEDGSFFDGYSFGANKSSFGEIVFTTGHTGYQETLTDPSYAGQIIVQTAPHIGNTGVNEADRESERIWARGYVVSIPSRIYSNYRATGSLDRELKKYSVPGIWGVDTRAITRKIRSSGSMRAGIFCGSDLRKSQKEQIDSVRAVPKMQGASFHSTVSCREIKVLPCTGEKPIGKVALLDLGVKTRTVRILQSKLDVYLFPADSTFEDICAHGVDGVFYSNGPGIQKPARHR